VTFLGFYIHNCISCFYTCEDHSLLDFTSAVQYTKYSILYLHIHPSRPPYDPKMTNSQRQWLHSLFG